MALAALDQFDMATLAPRRADHLSGGQQQRVAICRALVQEPEIVLADEPVASLDPRNARIVMDALQRINRHFGLTVLCNLHSLDLARTYCDRLVGMANGRVVFDDVPAALTDEVARELYGMEADEVIGSRYGGDSGSRRDRCRCTPDWITSTRGMIMIRRRTMLAGIAERGRRACCVGAILEEQTIRNWSMPSCRPRMRPAWSTVSRRSRTISRKAIGTKVTLRVANDYAAVIEGQRAGNIHIGYYGPASFSRARMTGVQTDAFVIDVNSDGTKGYYSVFYVRADSPLPQYRGSEGQESRPGRSELDLGLQHAAVYTRQAGHRAG